MASNMPHPHAASQRRHAGAREGAIAAGGTSGGTGGKRVASRQALLWGGLLSGALALGGCGAGEGLDGSFGAQDAGVMSSTAAGVTNTAPGAKMTVGAGPDAVTYDCPGVTVRTGAAAWQVGEAGALRYQGNIGQLARECAVVGSNMTVKVGIEGRVLLGEKGTPGTVKLPLRIAVVEEGPEPRTIATKFFVVPVEVPAGQAQSAFTVVEDQISFPLLKKPGDMERYIIYVGYDPKGQPEEKPKRTSRPRTSSKPKPAASAPAHTTPPASSTSHAPAASDTGAPSSDVFGPPPSSSTATGGFAPPPSTSTFEPPPSASTSKSSQ